MSSQPPSALTLAERQSDFTQRLILHAAVELLEHASVGELTVRDVAARANISERTVFRYFATRDAFLDAIAAEVIANLDMPPHPQTVKELLQFPAALYASFEAKASLVKAALHSELFDRIRSAPAQQRWLAVRKLVDREASGAPERRRKLAATNIRFYLSATTWHYYRFYFGFSPPDTVDSAVMAIEQSLAGLGIKLPRAK
jgi:AcrR family transcriptional regulator